MFRIISSLLSLISASNGFTNSSFNSHSIAHHLFSNSLPNHPKTIITKQNTFPTLRKKGFLFQFRGCKKDSDNITCFFVVKNELTTRKISIDVHDTRIVDSAGNQLEPSEMRLGNEERPWAGYLTNRMPTNVPIKGSATFRGSLTGNITLFDIAVYVPSSRNFHVEFINDMK